MKNTAHIQKIKPIHHRYISILFPWGIIYAMFVTVLLSLKHYDVTTLFHLRVEFILFGLTLLGVAMFHKRTMEVALLGLLFIMTAKLILFQEFSLSEHIAGGHTGEGEWKTLLNLFGLLLGFTLLARYFEESRIPEIMPAILPHGWLRGFLLLLAIMLLSSFLDNIAAAMLGGTIALVVYRGKIHMAFMAAIVAASNAGGAGSVVGDTTTTLIWIEGVSPVKLFPAYIGSLTAFLVFATIGAWVQNNYYKKKMANSLIAHEEERKKEKIVIVKLLDVILIIALTIATNYWLNFPALGVWIGILLSSLWTDTHWKSLKHVYKGTIFLLALVTSASLMPVNELPKASWETAFSLGILSSVFDNIPLTKLCLEQGGYDWALLAYAVGFGGSMIWFGSSAGVALSNLFPQMKSVVHYIKHGWFVTVAYIAGFLAMLAITGWNV